MRLDYQILLKSPPLILLTGSAHGAIYDKSAVAAEQTSLPFPTLYLVNCTFDAFADSLAKKEGRLNNCDYGDIHAKLRSISPQYSHC